ncbi:MAG: chemotaxis protein CheW [Proteobacteria bacterium]|nr:chemotaxis protein CheW [Pseudomonadota bacterium]
MERTVTQHMSAFEVLSDYERRSLAHVAGLPEQLDAPGLWRGVGYRIGERRLASGFDEVREILQLPQVTPVPGAQPWMLGLANVRGNLLPIVDLKQFLEGERTVLHDGQRILLVRQPGGDVAVLIDELFGQRSFNEQQQISDEQVEAEQLAAGRYTHFIDRAYRLGDQPWGVFSLERLARTPEFRQAAA